MNLREFISTSFVSVCIKTVGAFSSFLLAVVLARGLGAEESGMFFLCFSIVSFISVVSRLGLDNIVLRYVGESNEKTGNGKALSATKAVLQIVLLSSLFSFLLLAFLSYVSAVTIPQSEGVAYNLIVFSPYVIFLSIFTITGLVLQGLGKTVVSTLVLNISVNSFVVFVHMIVGLETFNDAVLVMLIAGFINVAFSIFFINSKKFYFHRVKHLEWSPLIASGLPLLTLGLVGQFIQWSGQFFLGIWSTTSQIAIFSIAQRTALLTSFVLMAVNMVVAPKFAGCYARRDLESLKRICFMSVRLISIVSIPIFLILFIFSDRVLSVFGPEFVDSATLLKILLVAQMINAFSGPVNYLLSMSGAEKDLQSSAIISGICVVALSVLLVPGFGAVGSAVAVASAIIIQNILGVYFVKKRLGFFTLSAWHFSVNKNKRSRIKKK